MIQTQTKPVGIIQDDIINLCYHASYGRIPTIVVCTALY